MRIELFRELLVLAETLNFHEAAKKLFVSQPTLTRHMQDLESFLGIRIFSRGTSPVAITPEGARVINEARAMCDSYDRIMRDAATGLTTELVIGVPMPFPLFANITARALGLLRDRDSSLRCSVLDTGHTSSHNMFIDGRCDVSLTMEGYVSEVGDIASVTLCRLRTNVWVSAESPLADRDEVSVRELGDMVFRPVPSSHQDPWIELVKSYFRSRDVQLLIGKPVDSIHQLEENEYGLVFGSRPCSTFGFGVRCVRLEEDLLVNIVALYRRARLKGRAGQLLTALMEASAEFDEVD